LGPDPGYDADAFADIQGRVQALFPEATGAGTTLTYTNVGLGYAGDPYGTDVAPQVELSVSGLQFTPITLLTFATFNLPTFRATMTMEDGRGTQSN
jgi:hypothetical protein